MIRCVESWHMTLKKGTWPVSCVRARFGPWPGPWAMASAAQIILEQAVTELAKSNAQPTARRAAKVIVKAAKAETTVIRHQGSRSYRLQCKSACRKAGPWARFGVDLGLVRQPRRVELLEASTCGIFLHLCHIDATNVTNVTGVPLEDGSICDRRSNDRLWRTRERIQF